MVILVQKEVAQRVIAPPGEMSLLSVAVQFFGSPEIVRVVPRDNFWPEPEVDSAILKIQGIARDSKGYQGALGDISVKKFFSTVKIGFSAKRKQLHNNLSAGFRVDDAQIQAMLQQLGINPASRAQDLTMENWIKIARNIQ
jgi:16S rRNA (adenine1518-N6/adenine1519-N6)-dimethyltransferase